MKQLDRSSIWFMLVSVTAILFPWNTHVSSVMISLLVIHWLWDTDIVQKIKSIKIYPITWLCWIFFALHLLGLIHTEYIPEGLQSIEVKLSFFILPLLFSSENHLNSERKNYLELFFAISCTLSFVYCIVYGFVVHPQAPLSAIFQRMSISEPIMHPGYYSNYFVFALVIISFKLLKKDKKSIFDKISYVLLILFFLFALLILISKTAMLFLACFLFFYIWEFTFFIKQFAFRLISFIGIILLVGFAFFSMPTVQYRIQETIDNVNNLDSKNIVFANSTGSRKVAWALEWDIIKHKPFVGYGTGASNPLLLQSFKQKGYDDLVFHNMHTHNQLFHTWIDIGILGVIVLVLVLLLSAFEFMFLQKDHLGLWMMILIIANILTDDMLEVQAGIVFFLFFWTLYYYKDKVPKRRRKYSY